MPGTRWLKFWNYVVLPALGIVALLMVFDLPDIRYEMLPIAILCAAVAFGLRERRLWAWRWNWVVLAVTSWALLVPFQVRDIHDDFTALLAQGISEMLSIDWAHLDDLLGPFVIRLVLVGLLWFLPNWLYWKKRKGLFS